MCAKKLKARKWYIKFMLFRAIGYTFVILRENKCDFAHQTQNNNLFNNFR